MFTTYRYYYKYGNEDDEIMCTFKEFSDFEKAKAYAHRYAKGIKFCGVQIQDSNGNLLYEITSDFIIYDYM